MQNEYFKKKIMLNQTILKLIELNGKRERKLVDAKTKRIRNFKMLKDRVNKYSKELAPGLQAMREQEKILNSLVFYMATEFMQPEEEIIKEGQDPEEFYFVI